MSRNVGLLVVVAGVAIVLIGLLIWSGALSWFGRLPGDIRYEGENTRVFIPITSGIVASIVLTVIINVVARLFR